MAVDYALDPPVRLPTARKAATIREVSAVSPTDEELLERVGRRDRGAFEVLYRRYSRSVLGLALRRLGDRGRAEDALQETFAAIWRAAGTYKRERGAAAPWLFAVARNSISDRGRARRARRAELALLARAQRARRTARQRATADRARILERPKPERDRKSGRNSTRYCEDKNA
jgi:RNA polymerase sigma-70 factor, ECF subfamily